MDFRCSGISCENMFDCARQIFNIFTDAMIRFFLVLQTHMCRKFYKFLESNHYKKEYQSSYRKKASTSSANISIPRGVRKCKFGSCFIFGIQILT